MLAQFVLSLCPRAGSAGVATATEFLARVDLRSHEAGYFSDDQFETM